MSHQDRLSSYNINTISTRQGMRIKKLVDPILNSLNKHYNNCIVDSKENYKFDLGVKELRLTCSVFQLQLIWL